jgi:phospholipase C
MKRYSIEVVLLACAFAGGIGCSDDAVNNPDGAIKPDGGGDTAIADGPAVDTPGSDGGDAAATDGGADAADGPKSDAIDAAPGEAGGDGGAEAGSPDANPALAKINHLVVIYLENWSFDSLYGEFAGAEGLTSPAAKIPQLDDTGTAYPTLPQVETTIPATLPNTSFLLSSYLPVNGKSTHDPVHRFYQEQMQIDGGKMDKFVAVSDAQGMVMGYFHTADLPLAAEAKKYTLADHFFHAAFGGSFLNHMWLIAAATPTFLTAPDSVKPKLDANNNLMKDATGKFLDGFVTPDNYVVNTAYTVNSPHPAMNPAALNTVFLIPNQTLPTIGDRLSDRSVTWAWYAGGWNAALAGTPVDQFQFHHQPFAYFANYADGTTGRALHLRDEVDFLAAAGGDHLPAVSFVKPVGINNEHPGYADVLTGEMHTLALIDAVRNGPNWKDTAIIVTYDENGGFWDHLPPPRTGPTTDRWGPGSRVPTLIISPYARKGYVDPTVYDTTSILAFIEHRWGLAPLSTRDANVADLSAAFDFSQTP